MLLNEDESTSLDFKRDQYPFDDATDDAKCELLKDILAFANAWRRIDAYILVGVNEVRGGRSQPGGVQRHLDDAKLQEFVNFKTNRPINFSYQVVAVEHTELGVIHVPIQDRPTYLRKNYGKLKANTVYIRRGSSTAIATPDEIVKMGPGADAAPVEAESKRKLRAILPWKGKSITLASMNTGRAVMQLGPVRGRSGVKLLDCNESFVTIGNNDSSRSISLSNIEVSFDKTGNCLELQERYG